MSRPSKSVPASKRIPFDGIEKIDAEPLAGWVIAAMVADGAGEGMSLASTNTETIPCSVVAAVSSTASGSLTVTANVLVPVAPLLSVTFRVAV